jgi:hypothetical protein
MDQTTTVQILYAEAAPKVSERLREAAGDSAEASASDDVRSFGVTFAGIRHNLETPIVSLSFEAYRAFLTDLSAFGTWDFQFQFAENGSQFHSFGLDGEIVRGSILPEHRFGLPDRRDDRIYYQFTESETQFFEIDSEVNARAGMHTYQALGGGNRRYSEAFPFVEVEVTAYRGQMDLNLALTIDAGRPI